MTTPGLSEGPPRMIDRIKRILLEPKAEWPRIDVEPATVGAIFRSWVLPLAAIPPLAALIGSLSGQYGAFGVTYRPSMGSALTAAAIGYAMALLGTWVLATIINALAPRLGGIRSKVQAMKVAAYSATAGWLAGIFQISATTAFLGVAGLYSLYLLYEGAPLLMKVPRERAGSFVGATIVAALGTFLLTGLVAGAIASAVAPRSMTFGDGSGSITVPGLGTVDPARLEKAAKQMEAATERAKASADGKAVVVAPSELAEMLPARIGDWRRTAIESEGASAGAMGGSRAEGRYVLGGGNVQLAVVDMSAMGAIASLGSAFNVESNKQDEDSYEKIGTIDDRLTVEEWNGKTGQGKYSQIVGGRFLVEAEGKAPDMLALMTLVRAVDLGRLEQMAKR